MLITLPVISHWRNFSCVEILSNATLLSSSINGSWWFMQTYVLFVMMVPLFANTLQRRAVWIPLFVVSLCSFQQMGQWIRPYSNDAHYLFHYFPVFYSGMIACKIKLFDRLVNLSPFVLLFATVLMLAARLLFAQSIWNIGIIVMMIVWMILINAKQSEKVRNVYALLGSLTLYMWLIHQFYIDYGHHFESPLLNLLWMYFQSFLSAYVVYQLYGALKKGINACLSSK